MVGNGLDAGVLSRRLREFLRSSSPEVTMFRHMEDIVTRHRTRGWARTARESPLRLFLAGYSGTGNIGADIRVAEMVRQLRYLFGPRAIAFERLAVGDHGAAEPVPDVGVVKVDRYLPEVLEDRVTAADGVVACEGSMFKSSFSNVLALLLTGSLALASAQHKLAVAWGAEAGEMDPLLSDFVERFCAEALTVARNPASERLLAGLGLRTYLGADPAWTYWPAPRERAEELLRSAGWDGTRPITCVCPVNPFWFPVRPDVGRVRELAGAAEDPADHFGALLFHEKSPESARRYHAYLDQLAAALREHARSTRFLVLVGMERLDRRACADLSERLGGAVPILTADELSAAETVAVLRRADLLVSSRYHAVLTATPGLVPTVGVATDERIPNLMHELGRPDLCVAADAPDLETRLGQAIAAAGSDIDGLNAAQGRLVAGQITRIGFGGRRVAEELARLHPGFHRLDTGASWERFVPDVDPAVAGLLESNA
ncbi:polysaccharide pyruvyl transferase family protein [Amycolatopsis sp. NPDC021455]|uniref:polysaccharide pyruvyl transferase family protein n=1 Tax=Amycolatopsis sp. NPDC021455 TaxID=3154901 RepID=UPI0034082FE9